MTNVVISKAPGREARLKVSARPFCAGVDDGSKVHNLLSPSEQARLAKIATVMEYRGGNTTIFSEGEDAHFIYAIAKGMVRITCHLPGGERQVLAFLWPGDLFGLAERGNYVNTADTLTPAVLYRFPLQNLRGLLLEEAHLQLQLLIKAAHALRTAQHQIIILGRQDVYHRLASFLLDLSHHISFHERSSNEIKLPMSRVDIGDYLGTSPETVTRAFARLERDGLISRSSPRTLRIEDLVGLTQLAEGFRSS